MIRRSTILVLVVFVVVLAAGIFLTELPTAARLLETETPTATVMPKLLSGWPVDRATSINVESVENGAFHLQRVNGGSWTVAGLETSIDPGKVEELISTLSALENIDTLPASTGLDTVGLQSPAYTLSLTGSGGETEIVQIGNVTPTESGYYVRLNQGDVVLVRKSSMDEVLGLLSVEHLIVQSTETAVPEGATRTPAS